MTLKFVAGHTVIVQKRKFGPKHRGEVVKPKLKNESLVLEEYPGCFVECDEKGVAKIEQVHDKEIADKKALEAKKREEALRAQQQRKKAQKAGEARRKEKQAAEDEKKGKLAAKKKEDAKK